MIACITDRLFEITTHGELMETMIELAAVSTSHSPNNDLLPV
jgi:hypothetical protein